MTQPVPPQVLTPQRPPRPQVPLRRAVLWTCVFSFLGAVLAVTAIVVLLLVVLVVILGAVAAIAQSFTWHDALADLSLADVAGLGLSFGLVLLTAGIVSTVLSVGMLLLLRLVRGFRTWRAVLQGLSAAGATYVVGSTLFTLVSRAHDVLVR